MASKTSPARRGKRAPRGIVQVFRFFLACQEALLTLGICSQLGKRSISPDYLVVIDWGISTLLLVYLSLPWLRRALGRAYLPVALAAATLGPVLGQAAETALHMAEGARGDAARGASGRLYVYLLLPLLIISAQYGARVLLAFTLGAPALSVVLAGALRAFGGPSVFPTAQEAVGLVVVYSMVGIIVVNLSKAERALREEEAKKRLQLAQYATTLEQLAVTRERNRLARDLHDTLAHTLSAVSVQLSALEVLWDADPDAARGTLRQTRDLTRMGLDEARRALHALRASPIEELGLALAIVRAAQQAAERAGLTLTLDVQPRIGGLRPEVEQHLYRIAEEALNNVVRHAQAQRLTVALAQRGGVLQFTVADDGAGFDATRPAAAGHYGLKGMRERAFLLDATLEVRSRPGAGTAIVVTCAV
jgi:signal transduction histidine kinase